MSLRFPAEPAVRTLAFEATGPLLLVVPLVRLGSAGLASGGWR